jgi:PAP2 superfamily
LTDREKAIAEYWADGPASETPPGHWCLMAQYISRRDVHNLDADVKMFFGLTNGLMDASISVWDCKRAYDYVRPITAIHFLFKGQRVYAWGGPNKGRQWIYGENWRPYQIDTFPTPPFAEYVSGHSTFSSTSAEILRLFTGSDAFGAGATIAAGSSAFEPGVTPAADVNLKWATFTAAAEEAGISRLYGGIHFADANVEGQKMGRKIAAKVWAKAQRYIDGTAQ